MHANATETMMSDAGYGVVPLEQARAMDGLTLFKGLQLDIGAPPQFMDFRYTVHDRWNGEFHLDHCGGAVGAVLEAAAVGPPVRADGPATIPARHARSRWKRGWVAETRWSPRCRNWATATSRWPSSRSPRPGSAWYAAAGVS